MLLGVNVVVLLLVLLLLLGAALLLPPVAGAWAGTEGAGKGEIERTMRK